jgi:hypothetical protein
MSLIEVNLYRHICNFELDEPKKTIPLSIIAVDLPYLITLDLQQLE